MTNASPPGDDSGREMTARLIIDYMHRTAMHHALWYAEVCHQLGREKAEKALAEAFSRSYEIQMKRLSKILGFEMRGDLPAPLADLPGEKLEALKEGAAVNWLATDGVWFQAVEFTEGLDAAKGCNDAAWGRFSPFEAASIRRLIGLPERPGLAGLKKALGYRLYAAVNKQSIHEETEKSFLFRMDECRVQSARKRKGLDDYPCKSAGIIEYSTFAESIDPRIRTECVGCPPDPHPIDWFCAWRFTLVEEE